VKAFAAIRLEHGSRIASALASVTATLPQPRDGEKAVEIREFDSKLAAHAQSG
jgi:hypothetical protein